MPIFLCIFSMYGSPGVFSNLNVCFNVHCLTDNANPDINNAAEAIETPKGSVGASGGTCYFLFSNSYVFFFHSTWYQV